VGQLQLIMSYSTDVPKASDDEDPTCLFRDDVSELTYCSSCDPDNWPKPNWSWRSALKTSKRVGRLIGRAYQNKKKFWAPILVKSPHWHLSNARIFSNGYSGNSKLHCEHPKPPPGTSGEEHVSFLKKAGYTVVKQHRYVPLSIFHCCPLIV
jgi:hypothetical protein